MTAVRRMTMRLVCLTVLALAGGLNAHGQSVPSESGRDDLLVREQFTFAYFRAQYGAAAATLLKEDPFSVNAVALLVRAGRDDDAITLVERIGQARPDLLASAFEKLQQFGTPYAPPWDPRAEAITARLKSLREQIERAPKSSGTGPPRSNNTAVASRTPDGESERALLNAVKQLDRARESLGHRKKRSVRDVATAMTPGLRLLRDMAERDRGPYAQRALAILAHGEFEAGQLREASSHFALLEERYQDSEVAWAAAMRAAQLTQSLGDSEAAAKSFGRVGAIYAGKTIVLALASFYEARAYESMARWPDALQAYRTAFNGGLPTTATGSASTGWCSISPIRSSNLYGRDPSVAAMWRSASRF